MKLLDYDKFVLYENERNYNDLRYSAMEQEFEPDFDFFRGYYYENLDKIYHTNIEKYRLILDILKHRKKVNDKIQNKKKKRDPFSFFKGIIDLPVHKLQDILTTWKSLQDD